MAVAATLLVQHDFVLLAPFPSAVIEGMDVVYKMEAIGSSSGKPSKKVSIADSGELPV